MYTKALAMAAITLRVLYKRGDINIHLRLRSRANRRASMKATVENMPEILARGQQAEGTVDYRTRLT